MNDYIVQITETLQRTICVWADSEEEAINTIQEQYNNEEIVLDSSNFVGVNFAIIEEEEEN